jgi:hypothetical protein
MGDGMAVGIRSQDMSAFEDNDPLDARDDLMSIAMHYDLGGARMTIQHDDTGHGDDGTDGGLSIGVLVGF